MMVSVSVISLCGSCAESITIDDLEDEYPNEVTDEQLLQDDAYMRKLYEAGFYPVGMRINLGDPNQYRALTNRLISSGFTPKTDPGLYKQLEANRADPKRALKSGSADCGLFGTMMGDFDGVSATAMVDSSCFNADEGISRSVTVVSLTINGIPAASQAYEWWAGGDPVTSIQLSADVSSPVMQKTTKAPIQYATCNGYTVQSTAFDGIVSDFTGCSTQIEAAITPNATFDMEHPINITPDSATQEDGIFHCMNRFWLGEGVADCDYYVDPGCQVGSNDTSCCDENYLCYPDSGASDGRAEKLLLDPPALNSQLYVYLKGTGSEWIDGVGYTDMNIVVPTAEPPPEIESAFAWLTQNQSSAGGPGGGICIPAAGQYPVIKDDCAWLEQTYTDATTTIYRVRIGDKNNNDCTFRLAARGTGDDGKCDSYLLETDLNISVNIKAYIGAGLVGKSTLLWRTDTAQVGYEMVKVLWGCLPPGTDIRLSDGTLSDIENIKIGDVVVSSQGDDIHLTVADISFGQEQKPLIFIETDLGHQLSMTSTHPVPLLGGQIVAAEELQVGDVVWTDSGTSMLTHVEERQYDGKVYNLKLGTDGEMINLSETETTMFANGVMVGDARMQGLLPLLNRAQPQKTFVIPQGMEVDYRSSMSRGPSRPKAHNGARLLSKDLP